MIITNTTKLPQSIVNLANFAGYEAKGDISVTRLIKPVRLVALFNRYKDKITVDAQDLSWSILGQAVHVLLERSTSGDVVVETRLHQQIYGWDVNGQPDAYHVKERRIDDYKITSVWAFMLSSKIEWEQQLNLNAMLHRLHDQPVESLNIVAVLRDWMRTKALVDLRYPQHQIHVVGQPVWDQDKCIDYAEERVRLHQDAAAVPDAELPLCTPSERWYRSGGWRVIKNGNKKAERVCPTEDAAREYIKIETPKLKPGRYFLEPQEKKGENTRCLHYCEARQFCPFALSLAPAEGEDDTAAE